MNKVSINKRGFSLLELLIVFAIIVTIAAAGIGSFRNFGKGVNLNSATQILISDLKQMRSNSMIGSLGLKWGVHFVNGVDDYYEIFSTPTNYSDEEKVINIKNTLPDGIIFSEPTEGNTKDIIFNKITGGTDSATVVLFSENMTETINITSIGTIY